MGFGHAENSDFETYLLCLYCCSNRVAKINLSYLLFRVGIYGTILSLTFYFNQLLNVFHVLFIRFCVPENNAKLHSVSLLISKHKNSIGKIAPFVIWTHCSNVNIRTGCNRHSQARAFPSDIINSLCIGNTQVFQMVSFTVEELDNCPLLLVFKRTASNCKHCATRIPLDFV